MKWYVVVDKKSGEAVSFGTELADPMPADLVAIELDHEPQSDESWDSKEGKLIKNHPSPHQEKAERLRLLRAKGWSSLSDKEKEEVKVLIFDIEGGPVPS